MLLSHVVVVHPFATQARENSAKSKQQDKPLEEKENSGLRCDKSVSHVDNYSLSLDKFILVTSILGLLSMRNTLEL